MSSTNNSKEQTKLNPSTTGADEKMQESFKTVYKKHPTDPHTKLYPTLEDKDDYLHCTDAEYAPYRFDFNNMDKAIQYLLDNGYVVMKNILNKSEVEKGKSLFWKFVSEKSIKWNKNDYKTWNVYNIGGELQNGLIWGKGMGQSEFQWYGRKHPKVLQIFSKLWSHKLFPHKKYNIHSLNENEEYDTKTDENIKSQTINPNKDLLTSFDGIGLFTPWYLTNEHDRTNSGWYHIDQNVKAKPGIHTIQSYISYYDQNQSTGSTCLIPKSHLEVREEVPMTGMMGDFIRIRKNCKLLDSLQYKKILICCKAGDMVLWDSRSIHCNSPALLNINEMKYVHLNKNKQRNVLNNMVTDLLDELIDVFEENKNDEIEIDLLRLVAMICMVPKWRLKNKKVLKNRIQAYIKKYTLSHWPSEYAVLNYPTNDIGKNNIEEADELTKSLIGYV